MLTLFALSGAAALVYQVIWARQLSLVLGNTTISVSIVLAAFMLGLGLGAALAGRRWMSAANPLRVYALVEGAIGVYALAFGPLVRAAESLYPALFAEDASLPVLIAARSLAALALLLVPTTLMGTTLPLTTEYLHRLGIRRQDWNAGRLYAANTLGAALGSAASGFLLIELVGIQATTALAALFNFAVMAVAFALARGLPAAQSPTAPAPPAGARTLLLVFACTGGLALAAEVLWMRALTPLLGSSTYAFSSILILYLVGIALGSWIVSGHVRRARRPELLVPVWILAAGAWHLLAIEIFAALYVEHGRLSGGIRDDASLASLVRLYLGVTLMILPPALLGGALFPAVTRLVGGVEGDQGGPIARAYTWNTFGAIAGSLVGGFLVAPFFVQLHAVQVLALGFVAVSLLAAFGAVPGRAPRAALALGATAVAAWAAAGLGAEDRFIRQLGARRPEVRVEMHASDVQGVTTVLRRAGAPHRDALLVNGIGMTVKVFATKAMAHVPIALHGRAEDTLVICFGMGTSFRSALAHGGRVDVVELVPNVLAAFEFFHADAAEVRRNPRGRMIANDGRNFLLLTRRRYDVISIDPPPPMNAAGVNHLYSRDFLELVRDRLRPGGIAAHWIPGDVQARRGSDLEDWQMVVRTFADVFPHVVLLPGLSADLVVGTHLLGSLDPVALDLQRVEAAFAAPAVASDLRDFGWAPYAGPAQFQPLSLRPPASGPLVTDDRPRLEFGLLRRLRARDAAAAEGS